MFSLLGAVLVASVLGSAHCVGMCGPFVALATSASPDRVRLPVVGSVQTTMAYNLGRLLTYVVLGLVAGSIGALVEHWGVSAGVPGFAAKLAGVAMVAMGVIGLGRVLGIRLPQRLRWTFATDMLGRLIRAVGQRPPRARALWLGATTTLIPCGWLHAFTVTAAGTGTPVGGVMVMTAFWLGTVPAMTLLGTTIHRLSPRLRRHFPWVMPALVLAVGLHTLLVRGAPVQPADTTASIVDEDPDDEVVEEPAVVPSVQEMPCH